MAKKFLIHATVLLALLAAIAYMLMRGVLVYFTGYSGVDRITSVILLAGELFIIIHGIGYSLNIFKSYRYRRIKSVSQDAMVDKISGGPDIAILVAARHEPREVLEDTFISLNNLNYPNKEIFLLDDSSDEKYKNEALELAGRFNLRLFRREIRHGAKAGIINDCLKTLSHKYVAIFDADQNPLPEFLNKIVIILENDQRLAFVQTPQFYSNIEESRVARAAALQQAVFYEYICEGKSSQDAMFCCGTNIVFRTKALLEAGGLDETTVTEDFATSLKLHAKGWKSLYYNHVYAFGMAPTNLAGYFKQQYRWANGTITVFKKILAAFLRRPFSLKPNQWWEYFLSGSYYMVGFAFFILMFFPILYLLFKVPSFFARPEIYLSAFLPYIFLSTGIFYFVLRDRNYQIKDLFLGQLLGCITFPVYMKAALFSFAGIKTSFEITEKTKGMTIPYVKLWPQIAAFLLNFIACVWGLNRFVYERNPAILVNCFWAFYHFSVLSSIFYFNAEER